MTADKRPGTEKQHGRKTLVFFQGRYKKKENRGAGKKQDFGKKLFSERKAFSAREGKETM